MRDGPQITAESRFEAIIREYGKLLRHVIAQYCPRDMGLQINDIEQDACLRLWRVIQTEKNLTNPASYIYRVAVSATIDAVRRVISRHEEQLGSTSDDESESEDWLAADPEQSPDRVAERRRIAGIVNRVMTGLAKNRRTAVELHLQGMNSQEIADLMDWTEPKARNLIYRGLNDLRNGLRTAGIDWE